MSSLFHRHCRNGLHNILSLASAQTHKHCGRVNPLREGFCNSLREGGEGKVSLSRRLRVITHLLSHSLHCLSNGNPFPLSLSPSRYLAFISSGVAVIHMHSRFPPPTSRAACHVMPLKRGKKLFFYADKKLFRELLNRKYFYFADPFSSSSSSSFPLADDHSWVTFSRAPLFFIPLLLQLPLVSLPWSQSISPFFLSFASLFMGKYQHSYRSTASSLSCSPSPWPSLLVINWLISSRRTFLISRNTFFLLNYLFLLLVSSFETHIKPNCFAISGFWNELLYSNLLDQLKHLLEQEVATDLHLDYGFKWTILSFEQQST